ncbi:MAG: hypothetical protein KDB80_05605 [Planctomycetes bacterium]|nr:hypothetical protein [Planctomycetota bacterium]
MLVPELKHVDCIDHDPIERWIPETDAVLFWLTLHVGLPAHEAVDMFTVPVANLAGMRSPEWNRRRQGSAEPIVVEPYSWHAVLEQVNGRLRRCAAHDWTSVWHGLRKEFAWEYEGM